MPRLKGVFIGQMGRGQTCQMRCNALGRLGFDMRSVDSASIWANLSWTQRHIDQTLRKSRTIERFNRRVLQSVREHQPAFVWAEKQEYLSADVLRQIKSMGILTIHYNPDPYFTLAWKRTAHMDECLAEFDVIVVTKRYELSQYAANNRGLVLYSPLGFDIVGHRRADSVPDGFHSDIAFVGGWEPQREKLILSASSPHRSIKVWGYGWRMAQQPRFNPMRALRLGRLTPEQKPYFGPSRPELAPISQEGEGKHGEIYQERYAAAVGGATISLGFLREICLDEHTTRSFEIPAMGGFMLGHRSEEHLGFFEEGREAEYFDSDEEFNDKIDFYLAHRDERDRIAAAGFRRCMTSGYSYDDRLTKIVSEIGLDARR
jgi:spore maturation protein CgeB